MAETTITSSPVNAPDVLMNLPLSRQVNVELESKILEPVSHNFTSATGGRTTFNFPAAGVLDSKNAALVFQLTSLETNDSIAYNFAVGGAGCIRQMTCRIGGNIASQITNCGQYMNIKQNFMPQEIQEGVMDARHCSSHGLALNTAMAKIQTSGDGAGGAASLGYQQLYNPEADQTSGYEGAYNADNIGGNGHKVQISKCLSNAVNQSPEIVIRLGDVFELFNESAPKLPLMAMALVQIDIEWNPCGDPNVAAANITENVVIDANIPDSALNAGPAPAVRGVVSMSTPNMILDYIHYDDVERQKIIDAVNSPGGMRMDFSEVLYTRGVNPAGTGTQQVRSNHILGMAMKEVKKIYVTKQYDKNSAVGSNEINNDATLTGPKIHRNELCKQFVSQQIFGESYNFFLNNQRIYDNDVSNPMVQHDYLSQCHKNYAVPNIYYDTSNYNANKMRIALDAEFAGGVVGGDLLNAGATHRYLPGSQHIIGLNLDKYNSLGSVPGNGVRLGSAPLEFNYSRLAVAAGDSVSGAAHLAEVLLDFFIVYRRSLIIQPLGVNVSDA